MEEEKIVRVYQADTYRFLGAFLEKGRGDDEVISCQEIWAAPWKGKMRLWLKAPQNFIGVVDLESSLTAGKPCWEKQYKFMDRGMAVLIPTGFCLERFGVLDFPCRKAL